LRKVFSGGGGGRGPERKKNRQWGKTWPSKTGGENVTRVTARGGGGGASGGGTAKSKGALSKIFKG